MTYIMQRVRPFGVSTINKILVTFKYSKDYHIPIKFDPRLMKPDMFGLVGESN
jgi:hypothetical protein